MSEYQPSLFSDGDDPPYQRHSPESRAAAVAIVPLLSHLRRLVLDTLAAAGPVGMTDEEIELATGLKGSTARPRRVELWRAGLVRKRGDARRVRSGKKAAVWVVTDSARME